MGMTRRLSTAALVSTVIATSLLLAPPPTRAAVGDVRVLNRAIDGSRPEGNGRERVLPSTSRNGSRTAFETTQSFDPSDDNGFLDVYLVDTTTWPSAPVLVSRAPDGSAGDGPSGQPAISGDGRYVVYVTQANDIAGETLDVCPVDAAWNVDPIYYEPINSGCGDVVRHDTVTGATELLTGGGLPAEHWFSAPAVNEDGSVVAFVEDNDVELEWSQVRLWESRTGMTTLVSRNDSGSPGDRHSTAPHVSSTGRYVAFDSDAPLVTEDEDDDGDVYRYDVSSGSVTLVSRPHREELRDIAPMNGGVTSDGAVVYQTASVWCDIYGWCDWAGEVFLRDTAGHVLSRFEHDDYYVPRGQLEVSDDGRWIVWGSTMHPLDPQVDPPPSGRRYERDTGQFDDVAAWGDLSGDGSHIATLKVWTEAGPKLAWFATPRVGFVDVVLVQIGEPTPPPPTSDLAVAWRDVVTPIGAGVTTGAAVVVRNTGTTSATDATVKIDLDPSAKVHSVVAGCTVARTTVHCALPSVAPGAEAAVELSLSYKRAGSATHVATVVWAPDGDATDDVAEVAVVVTR